MSKHILFLLILAGVSFVVSATIVSIGENADWPGFSSHTGFWGTHFLDSMLYALGNPTARRVVIFIWSIYLFLPSLASYIFVYSYNGGEK